MGLNYKVPREGRIRFNVKDKHCGERTSIYGIPGCVEGFVFTKGKCQQMRGRMGREKRVEENEGQKWTVLQWTERTKSNRVSKN